MRLASVHPHFDENYPDPLSSRIGYSLSLSAQYTTIPDPNFEAALSAYDDIPSDGQVPTANISGVTSLNVSNKSISDLTGIEGFLHFGWQTFKIRLDQSD